MSSRNAEPRRDRARARAGRRALSITTRLAVLYAAASLVLLVGLELALYGALVSSLRAQDESALADEAHLISAIVSDSARGDEELEEEVVWEPRFERSKPVAVRVLDPTGKVVVGSSGPLSEVFVATEFPPPTWPGEPLVSERREGPAGAPLLVASTWAVRRGRPPVGRLLEVVLDVSTSERLLAAYRRWAGVVLATGVVFSALLGVVVARAGMRPLEEMRAVADRITASRLAERIGDVPWPAEMIGLVRAFDAMLERLEGAFTRLARFSGNLAHELRTPLGNLMGEIGVALRQERDPAEYRRVLESAVEEVARLSRTIDALLFLARTESEEAPFASSELDARHEAEEVCQLYAAVAANKGVTLRCEGQGRLRGASELFRTALANLLGNALRVTPAGGEVRVVIACRQDGALRVDVVDTGPGIAPEHLPRIFERFYRAPPEGVEDGPGVGLGLAVVRAIVTRHGGSVDAHSSAGHGATFSLHFPTAAAAAAPETRPKMTSL